MEVLQARGINPDKMRFNSHGIDTSSWLPAQNTRKTNNVFRIGYLGQISKHKGVHTLIQAITSIRERNDLELRIYGNEAAFPSYTTALRKMIANDQRIQFVGKYPYENIARILSDIDVLVIPSLWNEIGPWVMYEAFETKTPVIASDVPNMSYVIKHGENGLLFELGNSVELTDQIKQIMEDETLYTRLVDGIRPPKKIGDEMNGLEIIYREVIAKENVTT
jgi:glycosyltransferase involved in cell wall biosynthesis